ncbi:7030_t:CDS:2 [Paraglomus brasilianum]|uniref:7030_t:CDS:1 n=1 Tax=Paraglomus brasilianum TaxID=144538 RepID=A0A9N9AAX1_9GLOM|nr:7030_t:CDS:2 [Paraglomus brasilianum]
MVKWIATATGVLVSGAFIYQFRHDIDSNTARIRHHLLTTQNHLEAGLPGHLKSATLPPPPSGPKQLPPNDRPQLPLPSISQLRTYMTNRLFPTFKSLWNDHITGLARDLNELTAKDAYNSVTNVYAAVKDRNSNGNNK